MKREIIRPDGVSTNPLLSPAARFGDLVFTSGMVGTDPETGELAGTDMRSQARQTMQNVEHVLGAAGTSLRDALKVTAFVADIDERPAFNEVYREFIDADPPPRTCVQAGKLGPGILVEVEVIAGIPR